MHYDVCDFNWVGGVLEAIHPSTYVHEKSGIPESPGISDYFKIQICGITDDIMILES